jgi:hypothetical protein
VTSLVARIVDRGRSEAIRSRADPAADNYSTA